MGFLEDVFCSPSVFSSFILVKKRIPLLLSAIYNTTLILKQLQDCDGEHEVAGDDDRRESREKVVANRVCFLCCVCICG